MDYLTNDTELTAVADAIREKAEITDSLEWPDGFIQAIEDCETGGPELEWLWGNQITNTMSGTIDSTDDAYAAPILNLGVDGASTQVTTMGKNLFNLQDYSYISGYFASEGDVIHSDSTRRVVYIPCVSNTTYVASRNAVQTAERFYIGYTNEIPATGVTVYGVHGAPTSATIGQKISASTTTGENAEYLVLWAYWSSNVQALDTLQIELGSTATTYEPYTGGKPSPNPDYPQDILSVDDLEFNVCGKNLAIDSDTEYSLTTSQYAHYDVAALKQDEQAFTVSIDATVPTGQTLQLYGWDGKNNSSYGRFVLQSDGRYATSIKDEYNLGYFRKVEELRIYSQPYTGGTSVITKVSKCQFEYGSTATAYEPYQGRTIPLYDGILRSLPDGTKDTLHLSYLRPSTREGWAWYSREVVQRVNEYVFTGTEHTYLNDWRHYDGYYACSIAYANIPNLALVNGSLMMAELESVTYSSCYYGAMGVCVAPIASPQLYGVFVRVPSTTASTSAELLEWLADKSLYYLSATPTTETLDPIELPIMPSENATVWCDGGSAQPTFMLEYIQNANIVISRLEDTIADLATS